jgi:hypothetical protein
VVTVEVALRLRDAGLLWRPAHGDRFVVLEPELLDQPFVLSDMTVDVHEFPGGSILGFNGTTEWALDSVELDRTVWVPYEHQLREQLGRDFLRLDRDGETFGVTLADGARFDGVDPENAYAAAVLHQLAVGADAAAVDASP